MRIVLENNRRFSCKVEPEACCAISASAGSGATLEWNDQQTDEVPLRLRASPTIALRHALLGIFASSGSCRSRCPSSALTANSASELSRCRRAGGAYGEHSVATSHARVNACRAMKEAFFALWPKHIPAIPERTEADTRLCTGGTISWPLVGSISWLAAGDQLNPRPITDIGSASRRDCAQEGL